VTRLDDISSHTNPLISNLVDQAILPLGGLFSYTCNKCLQRGFSFWSVQSVVPAQEQVGFLGGQQISNIVSTTRITRRK